MDDETWVSVVERHWPWLIPVVIVGYLLIKGGPTIKAFIWNPLIDFVQRLPQRASERVDAELEDLHRQVEFLTEQIAELRIRDELYWNFILMDQEYHRRLEFAAAEKGWDIPRHVPFMSFRDEWLKRHPTPTVSP